MYSIKNYRNAPPIIRIRTHVIKLTLITIRICKKRRMPYAYNRSDQRNENGKSNPESITGSRLSIYRSITSLRFRRPPHTNEKTRHF